METNNIKYKLTQETKVYKGLVLRRIKLLKV